VCRSISACEETDFVVATVKLVVSFSLVDGRNHHPNLDVVFSSWSLKFVVCPAVFFTWSIVSSWKSTFA